MRIDLPQCNFKTCLYSFDGNCTNKNRYETCEYQLNMEEIERLNAYIAKCKSGEEYWVKCLIERPNEAIKAFAEKLKEHKCSYDLDNYHSFEAVDVDIIDDIVKEVLGE